MATLLEMVDSLIGDVLAGNIYTNVDGFSNSPRAPLSNPTGVTHPHKNSNVIPPPQHSPPTPQRQELYPNTANIPPAIQDLVAFHEARENDFVKSGTKSNIKTPIFEKGEALQNRQDIYLDRQDQIQSNIAGSGISNPTEGDLRTFQKQAPPIPADTVGARDLPQANIQQNIYDDTRKFASLSQSPTPPNLKYLDISAVSNWLRNISHEVGLTDIFRTVPGVPSFDAPSQGSAQRRAKGSSFLGFQFLLTALNPGDLENGGPLNQVWNPLSLGAAVPLLGATALTNITAGAVISNYKLNSQAAAATGVERLLLMRKGVYVPNSPAHKLSKLQVPFPAPGFTGDTTAVGEGDTLDKQARSVPNLSLSTIEGQVDGDGLIPADFVRLQGIHTNIYGPGQRYSDSPVLSLDKIKDRVKVIDEAAQSGVPLPGLQEIKPSSLKTLEMFQPAKFPGGFASTFGRNLASPSNATTWIAKPSFAQDRGFKNASLVDSPGIGNVGVVEASFQNDRNEEDSLTQGLPIDDADIYMPFMFEDLREPNEQKRFLYFRAFLKEDISETFTPEWNVERYYGRVDATPVYRGTNRSVSLSFDVAAFQPKDLEIIYRKLYKLQSLVYPSYDKRGFMQSGPMIRMRVGDLFAAEGRRGLPGYIDSMDWSFPDGLWEIEESFKVPRLVTVNLVFNVIHDGNPGIYPHENYEIDVNGEVIGAPSGERTFGSGKFTTQAGGDTKVQVSIGDIRKIFSTVKNR